MAAFPVLADSVYPDKVSLGLWDLQRLPVKLTEPEQRFDQFGELIYSLMTNGLGAQSVALL